MTYPESLKSLYGVVGIGASGGGTASLRTVLSGLPERSGLAVVVASLGDAGSGLARLIPAGGPSHAFLQVLGDVPLAPDRVFVARGGVSVADSRLRRSDGPAGSEIDLLFRSLSEALADRVMALVLSGAGTDGSVGIAAVHERGGLVVVQDPAEAACTSMLQSAIRTGVVDRVLPVARIPEQLLRFARCTPQIAPDGPVPERDLSHLDLILCEVERATGHNLARYQRPLLLRRILRRMRVHGVEDLSRYARLVVEQGPEPALLLTEVLLPVSRFFRDRQVFQAVGDEVLPALASRSADGRPLNVWSAGCGTGEEAYSVAILLAEAVHGRPVRVYATDIHQPSLERAREGVYPEGIALDVGSERLKRFFARTEDGWAVLPALRRTVTFAAHDVLRDPPPVPADLVLCRNVLSHLAVEHHAEVIRRLHGALRPDGVLVVGAGEEVGRPDLPDLFEPLPVRSGVGGIHRRVGTPAPPPARADRRRELRSLSGELRETRQRVEEAASGSLASSDIELLRSILLSSASNLDLDACFCHLVEGAALGLAVHTGLSPDAARALERLPIRGSLLGEAVTSRRPVRIERLEALADVPAEALSTDGIGALVCQPVVVDGKAVATVTFCVASAEHLGATAMGWLGTVADLIAAARRRLTAEAALLARVDGERATNEQILQQLPSGVLLADASTGEIVFANLAAEQAFGTALPRTASDLESWQPLHADGRPYDARELPLIRALRGEVVSAAEVLLTQPDGPTYLHVNAGPVRDGRGVLRFAIQASADVTRQKRAEAALRELAATLEAKVEERTAQVRRSEGRFRTLVDASAQIVWSADSQGNFVEDSPSWRAFTGQSLEDWLRNAWFEMVHPADRATARNVWDAAIREHVPVDTEVRIFHQATRGWRWTHTRAVPHRDADGAVQEWVGMITDLTARKEAERDRERLARQLIAAEQDERERISRILHDDLQQILYGVMLKLRTIRRDVNKLDAQALVHQVDEARKWIDRAVETTRCLTTDLSPPVLRERGLVGALRWLGEQMWTLHGLCVVLQSDADIVIERDAMERLLFEVARELLFNVAKHAGVDRADVRLSVRDQMLVLEVIDAGRGYEGERGFGLTSIRERLRLLGGRLDIRGGPGEGTHATVFAPLGSDFDSGENQHRGKLQ